MTKHRRENTQIIKIRGEKGDITTNTKILMKSRESLESTLKIYIQVNWKNYMKWINS
jgi:hypothetical protein